MSRTCRTAVSLPMTVEERSAVIAAAGGPGAGRKGQGIATFIAASVLAFESLDRSTQAQVILNHHGGRKWQPSDSWQIPMNPQIAERLRGWNFRMFSQGATLRGAVLHFLTLSPAERDSWREEVILFISANEVAPAFQPVPSPASEVPHG